MPLLPPGRYCRPCSFGQPIECGFRDFRYIVYDKDGMVVDTVYEVTSLPLTLPNVSKPLWVLPSGLKGIPSFEDAFGLLVRLPS